MNFLLKIFVVFVVISSVKSDILVNTTLGMLNGVRIYTKLYFSYYVAFKGIPFAKPPVGDLRFKPPVPHPGWQGVREASDYGPICATNGVFKIGAGGQEDCLYLDVYSPSRKGNYPVTVWIHGGGFYFTDEPIFNHRPDFIVDQDIVVVTLNYRLGAFGFLSTGDGNAQGNYGLKDMVLALKFVKDNIANFGGDPERITLGGQSAGACATHYLLMSDMAKGLFNQAVMMSGTAFTPFAFQAEPLNQAINLGKKLGISFNSTGELVEKLRNFDFQEILNHDKAFDEQDAPLSLRPFDFVPCVEPVDSPYERLVTDTPLNLMRAGKFAKMPLIIGTTNAEGLTSSREITKLPSRIDDYNQNIDYFVPISYEISKNSSRMQQIGEVFKNIYFNGQNLTEKSVGDLAHFHTDGCFRFSADRSIKYFANLSTQPIYYYEFSYDGNLNLGKKMFNQNDQVGATHCDDLFYMSYTLFSAFTLPFDPAYAVQQRSIQMRTNFIKFGNPTPSTNYWIDKIWPQYNLEDEYYMDVGSDLNVKKGRPYLKIWHDYQLNVTGHW